MRAGGLLWFGLVIFVPVSSLWLLMALPFCLSLLCIPISCMYCALYFAIPFALTEERRKERGRARAGTRALGQSSARPVRVVLMRSSRTSLESRGYAWR